MLAAVAVLSVSIVPPSSDATTSASAVAFLYAPRQPELTTAGVSSTSAAVRIGAHDARNGSVVSCGADPPGVSVVIPTHDDSTLGSVLERLPARVREVIRVDGATAMASALSAGFAAATGDCAVAIDPRSRVEGPVIARFVEDLRSGCAFSASAVAGTARA
jgi:hypothetical protein